MANFKPGQSGNPNGRPKGTKNKSTETIKRMLTDFISVNLDDLQEQYNQLEAKEKLMFFEKIVRFVVPQKTETKTDGAEEIRVIRPRRD